MTYDNLTVLIPCHSLEDFPSELGETEAAGLLNAFAVVWHPAFLASAGALPAWHRADAPPDFAGNRLIIAPKASESWLQGGWVDRCRREGATVVAGVSDRDEMLQQTLAPLDTGKDVDPDLVADFLALGTCYLQIELLTRKMHYYSNLDEAHLQREAVAAAQAALAGDHEAARARLRTCFEVLTSARERFYPTECHLIDLCLLIPRLADQHLIRTLELQKAVNFLIAGEDIATVAAETPEMIERLKGAWESGQAEIIGGEWHEGPSPLLPVESVLWEFTRGHAAFRELLGRAPTTWARRRFGFTPLVPQLLVKHGYRGALHFALDDGIYPDTEQSRIRWEGCDGSLVESITRIPLAGDSAVSYLRLPNRMAESMEQDQSAAVVFARWPEVKAPWFEDLRRMQNYSPCLGRWVTFEKFFQQSDSPGRLSKYEAKEYFTPFLIQEVARQEPDPISRFRDHTIRRHRFDAALWCEGMGSVLAGSAIPATIPAIRSPESLAVSQSSSESPFERERVLEEGGPDGKPEARGRAAQMLDEFAPRAAKTFADAVMARAGNQPGYLVVNSLSFPRRVTVDVPLETPPTLGGAVKGVQFDGARQAVTLEMPPCGFVWLPANGGAKGKVESVAAAEETILRNEFFEVYISDETGGIGRIKNYGRSPNRLSQQLAYRFPKERLIKGDGEDGFGGTKSYYSAMRCRGLEITCKGPALGEIVTHGDLVDQADGRALAGFRQTIRMWRGRPVVELDIELDVKQTPDGDPWTNYFASRWAWNDETASLTRSFQQGAHGFQGERIESPHYLEIATPEQRTTILTMGLPFHRKTGPRMLDSLLITAGETARRFRFVIAVDADYPMRAALDAITPALVVPTSSGPPVSGSSGWLLSVDVKNVQIDRVLPLEGSWGSGVEGQGKTDGAAEAQIDSGESRESRSVLSEHDRPAAPPGTGFAVRLIETEGRRKPARLRTFRTPSSARQRDFHGRTITDLAIEGDAVVIELAPYEIADVELRFGGRD